MLFNDKKNFIPLLLLLIFTIIFLFFLPSSSSNNSLFQLGVFNDDVESIAISPNSNVLAVGFGNSGIDNDPLVFWNISTRKLIPDMDFIQANSADAIDYSSNGKLFAVRDNFNVLVWNISSKIPKYDFKLNYSSTINSIVFSPDDKLIASIGKSNSIILWNISTGAEITRLTGHSDSITSLAFSPNGRFLASGSEDETIKIWSLTQLNISTTLKGQSGGIECLSFSPDSKFLVSGAWYDDTYLWNVDTGEIVHKFGGHPYGVASVSFSPDGSRFVTGGYDNTAKLWDVKTGKLINVFSGHMSGHSGTFTYPVKFSPDGKYIVTAHAFDGQSFLSFWDPTIHPPDQFILIFNMIIILVVFEGLALIISLGSVKIMRFKNLKGTKGLKSLLSSINGKIYYGSYLIEKKNDKLIIKKSKFQEFFVSLTFLLGMSIILFIYAPTQGLWIMSDSLLLLLITIWIIPFIYSYVLLLNSYLQKIVIVDVKELVINIIMNDSRLLLLKDKKSVFIPIENIISSSKYIEKSIFMKNFKLNLDISGLTGDADSVKYYTENEILSLVIFTDRNEKRFDELQLNLIELIQGSLSTKN